MTLAITLGIGLNRPRGRRVTIDLADPVGHLARLLDDHRGVEAWWSPSVFDSDHRHGDNWSSAFALGADFDYREDGKKAPLPSDVRERIAGIVQTLPASLVHRTPKGMRAIATLDDVITSRELYLRVAEAFAARVANALALAGLIEHDGTGLRVDLAASTNLAALLFTPKATARGVTRDADVVTIGGRIPLASLVALPPSGHFPKETAALGKCPRGVWGQSDRSLLVRAFAESDMLGPRVDRSGKHGYYVVCPFEGVHSCGHRFDTSTIIFDGGRGFFFCHHDHCRGVSFDDVLRALPADAVERATAASDPWAGAIRVRVVRAKFERLPAKPWTGQAAAARVNIWVATSDGEVLPRQQVYLHAAAAEAYENVLGDVPRAAWLEATDGGEALAATLVGLELEIVLAPGVPRARRMRRTASTMDAVRRTVVRAESRSGGVSATTAVLPPRSR